MIAALSGLILLGCIRPGRLLPASVREDLAGIIENRKGLHIVDLELKDGRVVEKVWVAYGKYPALIGGRTLTQRYKPQDVVQARPHGD